MKSAAPLSRFVAPLLGLTVLLVGSNMVRTAVEANAWSALSQVEAASEARSVTLSVAVDRPVAAPAVRSAIDLGDDFFELPSCPQDHSRDRVKVPPPASTHPQPTPTRLGGQAEMPTYSI